MAKKDYKMYIKLRPYTVGFNFNTS
ncbi:uncharacterized protein METZ01_LOCUS377978 [marine metagenome]|uniref:Uncharacterized protein n=1 Tax=marine metagenome TaxID=408172 RepID=A0A382TST7_9ZZZZ